MPNCSTTVPDRTHHRLAAPLLRVCITLALLCAAVFANAEQRQYTYAWKFTDGGAMAPRGGTTQGPALNLDSSASAAWERLQEPGINDLERDRRAILAMAGPYRASFDFIETHGFDAQFKPGKPYQSWGTETVYVIEDTPKAIALQHVLVMVIKGKDGTLSEPMVVKHWRQDWKFQDRDMHEFRGHSSWQHRRLSRAQAKGTWTQAVYQVDDSPRYESFGRWEHSGAVSSWLSAETWRPLPRREFSVRNDYQVLVGSNRHSITPTGWVHEERNRKVVLDSDGQAVTTLAVESGLNRYERINGFDFSSGDVYWQKTSAFWAAVRSAWTDIYARNKQFTLAEQIDGDRLFMQLFAQAESSAEQAPLDPAAAAKLQATLERFVTTSNPLKK